MLDNPFSKIAIIGAGNVATHLGLALLKAGQPLDCICNRGETRGMELAAQLGIHYLSSPTQLNQHDLIIVAVSDDAINIVADQLKGNTALVVHTSGTKSLTSLSVVGTSIGVFYPLQSFSKNHAIDFSTIPICVYAINQQSCQQLYALATKLSDSVHIIDDEQRRKIHVAAVLVNNFSNYLYMKAFDFLTKNNLPVELLIPLIVETAMKIEDISPHEAQTGPAKRGDMETIAKHLALLNDDSELQALYQMMTNRILSIYQPKG